MEEVELVANAAFGLEAIVHRELVKLGFDNITIEDGRLRFRGKLIDVCRLNVWLRTAERVQIVVGDFPALDFDQLFDQTKVLPWERWLGVDAAFPVNARVVRSQLRSTPNIQKMVKRAIVERMRKIYVRHWFAETGPKYEIDVSIIRDRVLITLDTTGAGLHKRGYRQTVGDAPLRESLAAGMLMVSYWNKERLLIDPFCGTGTIPIEAAMIGRNMAPGRNRDFAAELWPQFPVSMWTEVRKEARDMIGPPLPIAIIGSDIEGRALKLATQHAEIAGVATDIHFVKKPFIEFHATREYGCVVTNPPYGERMGTEEEVSKLHHEMGEILTMHDTWSHYIITSAPRFEREFGRRADRRRKLFNGKIECTLYQYLGPRPSWEVEAARAGSALPEAEQADEPEREVPQDADSLQGDSDSIVPMSQAEWSQVSTEIAPVEPPPAGDELAASDPPLQIRSSDAAATEGSEIERRMNTRRSDPQGERT